MVLDLQCGSLPTLKWNTDRTSQSPEGRFPLQGCSDGWGSRELAVTHVHSCVDPVRFVVLPVSLISTCSKQYTVFKERYVI